MEYSLDDTLISVSGTSVRCMKCNQVFKVFKPTPSKEGKDEWLLRQAHGPFRTIGSLSVLQQWIREGKISRDDLLSQKNGPWKKVGDIDQLKVFFQDAAANPPPSAGWQKAEKPLHQQTLRRPAERSEIDSTERFAKLERAGSPSAAVGNKAEIKRPETKGAARRIENEKPTLPPPSRPVPPVSARLGDVDDEITHEFNRSDSKPPESRPPESRPPESRPPESKFPESRPPENTPPESRPPENRPQAEQRTSRNPVETVAALQPAAIQPAAIQSASMQAASLNGILETRPAAMTFGGDFSSIPSAKEDVTWGRDKPSADSEPAWTEKNRGLPKLESGMNRMPEVRGGGIGKWIILGVAVLGLGIAAFVLFTPSKGDVINTVNNMVGSPEDERFQKFFDRGEESFLLDTDTAFLQADREFQKALALKDGNPAVLAALGQMYAVWAQYYRDAKLDASADSAQSQEIDLLSRSFDDKLKDAVQWSLQASAADPKLKAALLAAADTARLSGNLEEASLNLKRAEALGKDQETDYVAVLIDMDNGENPKALSDRLGDAKGNSKGSTPLIRAIYRRARFLAAAGQKTDAKMELGKLFEFNSNHPQAKDLAARIEAGKPVLISPKNAPRNAGSGALVAEAPKAEGVAASTIEADVASEGKPQGIGAQIKKAVSLQHNGQTDAARALFETVLEKEPNNVEALTGVGYCHLDKGETGKAVASFRRAINVNASYGPALMGTAETYRSMGQKDQALKYYRSYLLAIPMGGQAEMAKKNVALLEAELENQPENSLKPAADKGDDETVVDDSPPPPSIGTSSASVEAAEAESPDKNTKDEKPDEKQDVQPAPEKSQIIILKKDTSEE
jgi:tetratricopeptide (TPR) repeat protein